MTDEHAARDLATIGTARTTAIVRIWAHWWMQNIRHRQHAWALMGRKYPANDLHTMWRA